MNLEEMISEAPTSIGAAPAMADLRSGVKRRRRRRAQAIGAAAVLVIVAVVLPIVLRGGDERHSMVSVRPTADGSRSSWERVIQIPDPDPTVPTKITVAASDGKVFVLTSEESPNDPAGNWVRVAALDPETGALTDLDYGSRHPDGAVFVSTVGWRGGPAVVVKTADGWSLDHWADGEWSTLERPAVPENALRAPWLATVGDDLVTSLPVGTSQGMEGERAWSTVDGRSWTDVPTPTDNTGYGYYSGDGTALVRQGFTAVADHRSYTSVLSPGASEWTDLPAPTFDAYGSLRSAEVDGILVSCGTQAGEARYDCSRWTPGDDAQRDADPPPFPQGGWEEQRGERTQVVAVPGRGVVVTNGNTSQSAGQINWALYQPDQDRWRRLPDPPLPGAASSVVVVGNSVYAGMFDGPQSVGVYRLDVGEDDRPIPNADAVGDGYRVRLPSERWTATASADGLGMSVSTAAKAQDGAGNDCSALQVDFVEGTSPGAPSQYQPLVLPESTPPCTPTVYTTVAGGRPFTMRVYRSGPTTLDDALELMAVIGSFRAERR